MPAKLTYEPRSVDNYSLEDGNLRVFSVGALERAMMEVPLDSVRCVRIGARLYEALSFDVLSSRLKQFEGIRTIVLSDDWIDDERMPVVQSAFETAWPGIVFGWGQELLAAGKHGR